MAAQIDWRAAPPFTINKHTEYPVNCMFSPAVPINWFVAGVNPNVPIVPRPTVFPDVWQESPGQPRIGRQGASADVKKAPWFYGEEVDLVRLVGNAVAGHGA